MKKIFTFLLLTCLIFSCKDHQKTPLLETNISVNLNTSSKEITFSKPIEGKSNWLFSQKQLYNDSLQFDFILKKAGLFSIWNGKKTNLFIEPGKQYSINNIDSVISFEGYNKDGQKLLNSIQNNLWSISSQLNNTPVTKIDSKLDSIYKNDLNSIDSLYKNNSINKSFYDYLNIHIENNKTIAKGDFASTYLFRTDYPKKNSGYLKEVPSNIISFWENLYKEHPVTNKNLQLSEYWYSYAKTFVLYYHAWLKQNIRFNYDSTTYYTECIDFSKTILKDQTLEYFIASFIFNSAKQQNYEKNLITAYQDFITKFPNSQYISYLEPEINLIKEYHQKIENNTNEEIVFINKSENINTLEELISLYKGRNLYIDIWATWCGPCKQEFEYSKELKAFLKKHNIKPLYISFDEERTKNKWTEMVKYFDLEGDHIRNNESLHQDLFKEYDNNGNIMIPWYIIVNKKGDIVVRHAKRPSDKEMLYKQLIETLNL